MHSCTQFHVIAIICMVDLHNSWVRFEYCINSFPDKQNHFLKIHTDMTIKIWRRNQVLNQGTQALVN